MGVDYKFADGNRIFFLILCGGLALLSVLFAGLLDQSGRASAQISPLSPLTVATPIPQQESQSPQVVATETPVPFPPPQPPQTSPDRGPVQPQHMQQGGEQMASVEPQSEQPVIPLGEPTEASPSLILIGALLVGLVLLVVLVLVVRRRE